MASYYVRSGAGGAATGADWANAYLTLTAAFSGKAAGDIFYVSEDHAESTAGAVTLTAPGTAAAPCFIYCVDHLGSVPPVSADLRTTATVTTTGNFTLAIGAGYNYWYGIIFSSGSGANAQILNVMTSGTGKHTFDSCALRQGGTNSGGYVAFCNAGSVDMSVELINTTVQVANAGNGLFINGGTVYWKNTPSAVTGATVPSTLILNQGNNAVVVIDGVDLSALGSGATLVSANARGQRFLFARCKLGSSVTIAGTPTGKARLVDLISCDSGATNYRTERYRYQGTQTVDTSIVRSGGATDGTTPISWKVVTTANPFWVDPFESQPITIWNETVGSPITVTLYGIWGGGAVPNNDDIWIEAEYLGASGSPLGSFATATKANNLATGSALSSDASTWGGSTTAFKMQVTFTPQQKGPINLVVKAAKASSTFYIDPKPEISGVTVSKSLILAPGVYANELQAGSTGFPASRAVLGM